MRNLFVPENLDLSVFSKPEKTARIVDLVIRRRFQSNLRSNKLFSGRERKVFYSDRYVDIPSRTLKNIDDDYLDIFEELHKHEVIERNYFDRKEHKAYGYRFMEGYRDSLLKCVSFPPKSSEWLDVHLRKRREKEREFLAYKKGENAGGYLLALDHLNSITLEYEQHEIDDLMWKIRKQDEWKRRKERLQKTQPKRKRRSRKDSQGIAPVHQCNHILFKQHEIIEGRKERLVPFYSVDDFGRFHYYLTNFPKMLRPFMRLNGKRVVGYDITSSQCIFFALAVRKEARRRDGVNFDSILSEIERERPQFLPDKEKFLHDEMVALGKESMAQVYFALLRRHRKRQLDTEIEMLFKILSDDFYEFMMIKSGAKWDSKEEFERKRKTFKEDFFEFLYGANNKRGKIFRAFQETFPYITLVLWKMKNLGGMYQRVREIREERQKDQKTLSDKREETSTVWKQLRKEAKKEKKWYIGLPLLMQETEADFMFNKIAPQIGRHFLPVHDAILVEKTARKNVKDIAKLLRDEFKKLGVEARINPEDW